MNKQNTNIKRKKKPILWIGLVVLFFVVIAVFLKADSSEFRFMDLWLTPDQQGRYYFENGDYKQAAEHFADPFWKGTAYYKAGEYDQAINWFARNDSATAYYNLGNSYAWLGSYEEAVKNYDQALKRRPNWRKAEKNRTIVAGLIKRQKENDSEEEAQQPTFSADKIEFGEKGKKGKEGEVPLEMMSEEQIAEMWLRRLQNSPADFLRQKFIIQTMMQNNTTEAVK